MCFTEEGFWPIFWKKAKEKGHITSVIIVLIIALIYHYISTQILYDPINNNSATYVATVKGSQNYLPYNLRNNDHYIEYFTSDMWWYSLCYSPFLRWIRMHLSQYLFMGQGFAFIYSRNKLIDEVLLDYISNSDNNEGYKQIIIIGAGYDTRFLKFQDIMIKHNIKIFELDLNTTQQRKLIKLQQYNIDIPYYITFIPINLETQDLQMELKKHGYNNNIPSIFIMEGVSMYLTFNTMNKIFQFISETHINSIFIVDILHRCWLLSLGIYHSKNIPINPKYCQKHKMMESNLNKQAYHQTLSKYNTEPFYFSLDWNISNPNSMDNTVSKKGLNYLHLYNITNQFNLKLIKYYGHKYLSKYIYNPSRKTTFIKLNKGYSIIILSNLSP